MIKEDAEIIDDLKVQANCIINCAEQYASATTKQKKKEWLITLYLEKERFDGLLIDLEDE